MSCLACDDRGLVPFVDRDNPKPNAAITVADLFFAVCLCAVGRTYRRRENEGRKVPPLSLVWCAREQVSPERICMIEDAYSADELKAAGLSVKPPSLSREAALLARGRK